MWREGARVVASHEQCAREEWDTEAELGVGRGALQKSGMHGRRHEEGAGEDSVPARRCMRCLPLRLCPQAANMQAVWGARGDH